MKRKITSLSAIAVVSAFVACVHGKDINFELYLKVLTCNEINTPIENADVQVGFTKSYMREKSTQVKGETDSNGVFKTNAIGSGTIGVLAKKNGYYESWIGENFFINSEGQLSPYDPVKKPIKILMRKRMNPIPMHAKRVARRPLPEEGKQIGFDLVVGDWVSPYGTGERADFIFAYNREVMEGRDYHSLLDVTFSNKEDGIQLYSADPQHGSKLRLPNHAPENGYLHELKQQRGFNEKKRYYGGGEKTDNYFFRVRTKIDEKGDIISAMYGKIHGPIRIAGARRKENVNISFLYYLNPTPNDTNVEFDPDKNLFKSLKYDEEVRNP